VDLDLSPAHLLGEAGEEERVVIVALEERLLGDATIHDMVPGTGIVLAGAAGHGASDGVGCRRYGRREGYTSRAGWMRGTPQGESAETLEKRVGYGISARIDTASFWNSLSSRMA
jgi:hypothetical protein